MQKEMLSQDQIGRLEKIGIYWETVMTASGTRFMVPPSVILRQMETLMSQWPMFSPEGYAPENGGGSMHIGIRRRAMRFYHKSALSCWMTLECREKPDSCSTGTNWRRNIKQYGNLEIPAKYKDHCGWYFEPMGVQPETAAAKRVRKS